MRKRAAKLERDHENFELSWRYFKITLAMSAVQI